MQLKKESFYEYGSFRLDPAEHRLTRNGIAVPLAPEAFELLLFLVQNQGRLSPRSRSWNTLAREFRRGGQPHGSISVLRKVLGEKEGNLRYIETIPKKGYRFIASVREVQSTSATLLEEGSISESPNEPVWSGPVVNTIPSEANDGEKDRADHLLISAGKAYPPLRRHRWTILTAAILVFIVLAAIYFIRRKPVASPAHLVTVQRSLAILPLRNLRQNPQDDFLGFSLADAVITGLGPISSLTVRPSSAIEKYKGQMIDLQKIGADWASIPC